MRKEYRIRNDLQMHELAKYIGLEEAPQSWNIAFEYVHSIKGKNVFIASNKQSMINYQKLNVNGIIDECFEADFEIDSKISEYVQRQISLQEGIFN